MATLWFQNEVLNNGKHSCSWEPFTLKCDSAETVIDKDGKIVIDMPQHLEIANKSAVEIISFESAKYFLISFANLVFINGSPLKTRIKKLNDKDCIRIHLPDHSEVKRFYFSSESATQVFSLENHNSAYSSCPVCSEGINSGVKVLQCPNDSCSEFYHEECFQFLKNSNKSHCTECGIIIENDGLYEWTPEIFEAG